MQTTCVSGKDNAKSNDSFFLSILHSSCLTMMGVGRHIRYLKKNNKKKKKQEKITIQIFDKATSVKTIFKQSLETDISSHVPAQP